MIHSPAQLESQGASSAFGLEHFQYSPDNVGQLQDLATEVSAKWKIIARYLGVPENTIESIDMQYRGDGMDECLMKVFDWWCNKGTMRYTWATIINILEKPSVDRLQVARHLRQTLNRKEPDPSA